MAAFSLRSAITALAAALTLAVAMPAGAALAPAAAWTANSDDALLFEVRLGQYRMSDGVRGYQLPGGICVDLADTLLALDIPIRLDKQLRRATGWAFEERHTVVVDRASGIEQIVNKSGKVAPRDIVDTPEGWCVDTTVLSRWFGATFVADAANAVLTVKADRKLPPEAAAERRARAAITRPAVFDLATLPQSHVRTASRLPAIDVIASAGGISDRRLGNRVEAQYELYAAGAVGRIAYNARLSSDRHGLPKSLRVQAYRTDPTGGLPLGATTIAIGDITGLSTPLVAASSAGRGAMITNRPVERQARFDRIDLRGELPRGWDAELYRNSQLIAFANDRADGRYEFLDVALQYGQNRFEVVLYGPQGQVRREVRSVPVGLDSIPPRKTYYWAGVDEDGRDLIELSRAGGYRAGGWRGSAGVERGIDAKTSVALTTHSLMVDQAGRQTYLEAGGRRALGAALIELSGAAMLTGGHALRAQIVGERGRTHYAIETIWADRFMSDRIQRDVTGLHTATIDTVFGDGRGAIPLTLQAKYTRRTSGSDTLDVAARVSALIGRVAVTGDIGWRGDTRSGTGVRGVMTAGLLANARIGRVRLRGEARLRLSPTPILDTVTIVGEWAAGDPRREASWRSEVGYDQTLGRARLGLGYARRFDRFALSANGEVANDGSVAAGISVAFSLGPDPRRGRSIRITADKIAARGTVIARVFRDENANGRHDSNEAWEKDVAVTAGQVAIDAPTDINGEAIIDGLEPFQPVLIGIDASALPDPLVQPSLPGMVVTPRPGIIAVVELPLVGAGEIDGTLARVAGSGIEGVDLELIDAGGRIAQRTRTDFDGYFLFERVPYGPYSVRIAPLVADATRLSSSLGAVAEVGRKLPSVHLGTVSAQPATRSATRDHPVVR